MSRTQLRAKIGATLAVNEEETVGETEVVPAAAKTQTTTAGTGDKICCGALDGAASSGAREGAGAVLQQGILPPQPQT